MVCSCKIIITIIIKCCLRCIQPFSSVLLHKVNFYTESVEERDDKHERNERKNNTRHHFFPFLFKIKCDTQMKSHSLFHIHKQYGNTTQRKTKNSLDERHSEREKHIPNKISHLKFSFLFSYFPLSVYLLFDYVFLFVFNALVCACARECMRLSRNLALWRNAQVCAILWFHWKYSQSKALRSVV